MRLTAQHLRELGACDPEADRFEANFPKGLPVTEVGRAQAKAMGFNRTWLKNKLTRCTTPCDACDVEQASRKRTLGPRLYNALRRLLRNIRI